MHRQSQVEHISFSSAAGIQSRLLEKTLQALPVLPVDVFDENFRCRSIFWPLLRLDQKLKLTISQYPLSKTLVRWVLEPREFARQILRAGCPNRNDTPILHL